MPGRRAFVAGSIAAWALPAFARKKAPPPPKVGAIRWPGPGYELHGFMAIPAKAHGPQPAVMVIPDTNGPDPFALGLTDALAEAGFVTCIPRALASLDEAMATIQWLATNTYATGRVGAVGFGWGGGLVQQAAAAPDARLACGVVFGGPDAAPTSVPLLTLPALATSTDSTAYAAAWRQAVAFLGDHLGLQGRSRKTKAGA
jgi:carboxymethylenebutenolidase